VIADLLEGSAAVVSGKRHRERRRGGVFKQVAPLSVPLSLPLKWASTSTNSVAQCRYEPMLHALFFSSGTSAVTNQNGDFIYFS